MDKEIKRVINHVINPARYNSGFILDTGLSLYVQC